MRVIIPPRGFDRNPLKAHRNAACPCGSGLKVKRCHGLEDYLPIEAAESARKYLAVLASQGLKPPRLKGK
jgi:hypothetical protein